MKIDNLLKTENFCIVPFCHLYYSADGYVYPCPSLCDYPDMRLGSVKQTPQELWNSPVIKALRSKMLKNEFSLPCYKECNGSLNSCKKYVGTDMANHAKDVIETAQPDGECDFNFISWNAVFDTTCNQKCNYCSSRYSTSWVADEKLIYGKPILENVTVNKKIYYDNMDSVKEVWFGCGEPSLQQDTYDILEKLDKSVKIRLITNLTNCTLKGRDLYALLCKFDDAIVFGSWDLDGERGSYIRYGSCEKKIINNIKRINHLKIRFYLQPVISIFNIYYLFDFHKSLFDQNLIKKDSIRYYNLSYPEFMRYSVLTKEKKEMVSSKLNAYKVWLGDGLDTFANKEAPTATIDKIIQTMHAGGNGHWNYNDHNNSMLRQKLLKYLIDLDNIRYKKTVFNTLFQEILL